MYSCKLKVHSVHVFCWAAFVEFDPVFWLKILKKLQLFFVEHLAPELLTGRVLKDVKN